MLLVALGAILLVPSASFGAAATANVSAVITRVPGGVKVVLTSRASARR
jgi:hypothetical protein